MKQFRAYAVDSVGVTQLMQAPHLCSCTALGGLPLYCADMRTDITAVHKREELALYDLRALGFGALAGVPALRWGADVVVAALQDTQQALVLLAGEGLDFCSHLEASGYSRLSSDELSVYQSVAREQWRKLSDVASILASYLRCHPQVAKVHWPGLTTDQSFTIASRMLEGGFGARIDWQLKGCEDWHSSYAQLGDWTSQVLVFERNLGSLCGE